MEIWGKYRAMNVQVKAMLWFTFVGFFQRGMSLLTAPIFTRVLSTEDYGVFSVYNAYSSVLVIIATLWTYQGAQNNALIRFPEQKLKIVSTFQSLSFVISFVFLMAAIAFRRTLAEWMGLAPILVVVMFLSFVFASPANNWICYKKFEYDYIRPVIYTIVISALTPICGLAAVFIFNQNQGVARTVSYVVVNTILPGAIFYCINYIKGKSFFDASLWKYALAFNIPLIPHYLAETFLNQTDRIMINTYFGTSEAGIYSVAYSAASIILIFTAAANSALVPFYYRKLKEKEYRAIGKVTISSLIFVAFMMETMTLFAPEVIRVLAGKDYSGAVYLVPTLSASVFFNFLCQIFARVELYFERKIYSVIATFGAAAANVGLNMLLMPVIGYQGAGYATLISHLFFCLLHYLFYRRIVQEQLGSVHIYNLRAILMISVGVLATTFLFTMLYRYFVIRLLIFGVGLLVSLLQRKKIKEIARSILTKDF